MDDRKSNSSRELENGHMLRKGVIEKPARRPNPLDRQSYIFSPDKEISPWTELKSCSQVYWAKSERGIWNPLGATESSSEDGEKG